MLRLKLLYGKKMILSGSVYKPRSAEIRSAGGVLRLGRSLSLKTNVHIISAAEGELFIGDHVFFNRNCIVVCREHIEIGNHCLFGPNVCIYDHDHLFDADGVASTDYKTGRIEIGDGCWIGAGVIILRGSRIGSGSVIGAGAIIKGEIPKKSIVTVHQEQHVHAFRT